MTPADAITPELRAYLLQRYGAVWLDAMLTAFDRVEELHAVAVQWALEAAWRHSADPLVYEFGTDARGHLVALLRNHRWPQYSWPAAVGRLERTQDAEQSGPGQGGAAASTSS